MTTKDKWVTEEKVAAECDKLIAEGVAPEAINANMIIDRLQTKGRGTVYKYVDIWRRKRAEPTALAPFSLSPEMTQKVVSLFTATVSDVVAGERRAAIDKVCAADQQIAQLRDHVRDLQAALEVTERERDEANEQSAKLDEALKKAVKAAEVQLKLAEVAKSERDAVYAQYLPWLLINGHPEAD